LPSWRQDVGNEARSNYLFFPFAIVPVIAEDGDFTVLSSDD